MLISGYQESKIRQRNMNWRTKRKGPSAAVTGATQTGASATATNGRPVSVPTATAAPPTALPRTPPDFATTGRLA